MTHQGRSRHAPAVSPIALALACHPGPTVAVTAITAVLAGAVGQPATGVALVTGAVLAGQLSIGWGNDWLDRDRDRRTARTDKPLVSGAVTARTVLAAALIAAVACLVLSLASGTPGLLHLAAVASGWSYNLGLKATAVSPVPFALSFGLLPAYVVAAAPGLGTAPAWMITAGALLGTGAHFANVLPDLADDVATGVRGLGHRIGHRWCVVAATAFLVAAVATLAGGPPGPPTAAGWVAVAVATATGGTGFALGRRRGSRSLFTAVLILAVVAVALLLASGTELR